jgi:CDP-4-dehydro-6-deoxyglucose reductase
MDNLLSLSQAARTVGVKRRNLQQLIQEGKLHAFEGSIRLSELRKIFPTATVGQVGMVERMERIKDGALHKLPDEEGGVGDIDHLRSEVHRLSLKLGEAEAVIDDYRAIVRETQHRLIALQSKCDKRESLMLNTIIGWFMHQCKLRESR